MKKIIEWILSLFNSSKKSNSSNNPEIPDSSTVPPIVNPEVPTKEEVESFPIYNPKPDRDNSPVRIVDVYHGDNITDWKKLGAFADAIILKVSEGVTRKDPEFQDSRREARKNKLLVGYYHFFRSHVNAEDQANLFCDQIVRLEKGDFCVCCDFETEDDEKDGYDILEVERFNNVVEKRLGMIPMIYGGRLLKENITPERFKRYPLWLSHYTSKARPVVPRPWTKETIWQFTESAHVPGISNPKGTDLNRFSGTYQDLLKMCVNK